jgi:hypothetical protein
MDEQRRKYRTKIRRSMGRINEPEKPTRQLLPIMSTKCWEGRKDKGGGGGSRSKTRLRVTKLYVKDGV